MSQDRPSPKVVGAIKILWQNRIPPKIISEVLEVKYPVVSLYCRSFKAISKQLDPIQVVAKILDPHSFYKKSNSSTAAQEIMENLLTDSK